MINKAPGLFVAEALAFQVLCGCRILRRRPIRIIMVINHRICVLTGGIVFRSVRRRILGSDVFGIEYDIRKIAV